MVRETLLQLPVPQIDRYSDFRSYLEGLERGYLTENPAELHNPDVCAPYIIHEEPVGSVAD